MNISEFRERFQAIHQEIARVLVGQDALVSETLIAVLAAFAAWLAGRPVSVRRPSIDKKVRNFAKAHTVALWSVLAGMVVLAAGFAWWSIQGRLANSAWTVSVEETFDSPTPAL